MFITVVLSQQSNTINATIDPEKGAVKVNQIVTFTNHTNKALNSLYFMIGTIPTVTTQLFCRKNFPKNLILSSKDLVRMKRKTSIHQILSNQKLLKWHRLKKQIDIIVVDLIQHLLPGASQDILISYTLQLPSSNFTGYGIDSNQNIIFRNGFLQFANQSIDGQWYLDSNYGFNDMSASHSTSTFSICFQKLYDNSFGQRGLSRWMLAY